MKGTIIATSFVGAAAFMPAPQMSADWMDKMKAGITKTLPALIGGSVFIAPSISHGLTKDELSQLSYLQVKGTGLANRCPEVKGEGNINVGLGGKKLVDLCLEPKQWQVEEEFTSKRGENIRQFVNTRLVTRQTYTLDGISGDLNVGADGKIKFEEKEGIDYAATTVQMPGGERVPMLFTIKELVAQAANPGNNIKPGFQFGGQFTVPSYRTGTFLDPKGRGMTSGYDMAVALPALQTSEKGDEELYRENNKTFDVTNGNIELEVSKVNSDEGEIGGVFVSTQFGDTDQGSHDPKKILLKGIFYGRVE